MRRRRARSEMPAASGVRRVACAVFALAAAAGVSAFRLEMDVDVSSASVWRGMTLNDQVAVQPSLTLQTRAGPGASLWGSLDFNPYREFSDGRDFSEVQSAAWYRFPIEGVDLKAGIVNYSYPDRADFSETREAFVSSAVEVLGVGVCARAHYDFDVLDDYYLSLELNRSIEISDFWDATFGAAAGYAGDGFAQGGNTGWHDYMLSAGVTYATSHRTVVGITCAFADTLHRNVLPEQDVDWYGGLHLSHSF